MIVAWTRCGAGLREGKAIPEPLAAPLTLGVAHRPVGFDADDPERAMGRQATVRGSGLEWMAGPSTVIQLVSAARGCPASRAIPASPTSLYSLIAACPAISPTRSFLRTRRPMPRLHAAPRATPPDAHPGDVLVGEVDRRFHGRVGLDDMRNVRHACRPAQRLRLACATWPSRCPDRSVRSRPRCRSRSRSRRSRDRGRRCR